MMKWLGVFLSFLIGKMAFHAPQMNFKESAMAIFEEVVYKSRKTVTLLLTAFASLIFICGGLFISLIDATRQYDQAGVIEFSATFISGLVLLLIAAGTVTWVFASAWPGVKRHDKVKEALERATPPPPPHTLESAISALIMDFVKEREAKREKAPASTDVPHPPPENREETPPIYTH